MSTLIQIQSSRKGTNGLAIVVSSRRRRTRLAGFFAKHLPDTHSQKRHRRRSRMATHTKYAALRSSAESGSSIGLPEAGALLWSTTSTYRRPSSSTRTYPPWSAFE